MDAAEARAAIPRPQVQRLKDLGMGLKVAKVMGTRILVKPVKPFTEMDNVEKKGLLIIPEQVRDQNTPLPTVGEVVQLGIDLSPNYEIQPGTYVMFSKYAGMTIAVDQGEFIILQRDEVACTLEATNPSALAVLGE